MYRGAARIALPFAVLLAACLSVTSCERKASTLALGTQALQAQAMAVFAYKNLGARKAAVLKDGSSSENQSLVRAFANAFMRQGGEVVGNETYAAGALDLRAQLKALRAKRPDIVAVPAQPLDAARIALQAREVGLTAPLIGGDLWDSPVIQSQGGAALDGHYFVNATAHDLAGAPGRGVPVLKFSGGGAAAVFATVTVE